MLKSIHLNLLKIKYSGNSIGDDICVEVRALDKFLRVDKKIKAGATAEINREVGRFETDRSFFQTEISISVIEKDLIFNDLGNAKGNIKIDTTTNNSKLFVFDVEVRENRSIIDKFWGKSVATFEITIEVKVTEATQCVPDQGDGWLAVVLDKNGSRINLPAYLHIKVKNIDKKREYFTILEGFYHGENASIALRKDGSSQFVPVIDYEKIAVLSYSISEKLLSLNGKKYETADYSGFPWKKGLYDIEIPDYPHSEGSRYLELAPKARIWFRIGHSGERYLHTGSRSLGCITVIEKKLWSEIFNSLIKARKGDFISVGVLEVVD